MRQNARGILSGLGGDQKTVASSFLWKNGGSVISKTPKINKSATSHPMSNSHALYDRYQAAFRAYAAACASAPEQWHRPDVAEFEELRRLLQPHAESGDMYCQYALATIHSMGLCCESEQRFLSGHVAAREAATRWWIAAAMQGFWPALDTLVTSGVGPEAQRAREAFRQLDDERRDLAGKAQGMPVYGPEFFLELRRRLYGNAMTDAP